MTAVVAILILLAVVGAVVAPLLETREAEEVAASPAGDELWRREKAVAVLAITEADFDRATGKLSDDDYRELRSDYEGRALEAMDHLDRLAEASPVSGAAVEAGPSTARFCSACGAAFGQADAFCGSCGRRRPAA